ncbi:peptidoglycan DD-metalloendopeptidase family protein [Ferrimonas lipolytica]|uniref:Peptidoglycan DD-metalloendopeptidase family protein n=1 Tax=Ferrimonas lipolytica TaxID=2724191 RepID=A0A6H1UET7_9GAMM|nr:peptidoglycan DD-metalloendopeptidase family protein [Ferrimonas lipolytica]QIZ77617.1 peptidoglycan DD-metalloendopeptidase family protein [Ferrimonas lipolytica]
MTEAVTRIKSAIVQLPTRHKAAIAALTALMAVIGLLPSPASLAQSQTESIPSAQRLPLTIAPMAVSAAPQAPIQWRDFTVKNGDSMALLFNRAGLSAKTLHQITQLPQASKQLTRIKPGQTISIAFEGEQLAQLRYQLAANSTLLVTASDQGFTEQLEQLEVEQREQYAAAEIKSNFWNAAVEAGLTPNTIMQLAGLFGWDIDFALDIRQGDSFSVLWENNYIDGQYVNEGKILVAEFVNQGETFRAIRHSDGNYYSDNGSAMKKAFLRAPVQFNYVSSNFNPRRLHPVTGRVRAHNGTDYVAPRGTPIMAAGDGVVTHSTYNNLNGNYVFIKHSNTYVTKYLHLSKRLVKKGQRVKQGQSIGKLGSTGRVTGAHLHYEFLVNGVHRNPRTVKLPQSKSLSGKEKQTFLANASNLLEQLNHRQSFLLASRGNQQL